MNKIVATTTKHRLNDQNIKWMIVPTISWVGENVRKSLVTNDFHKFGISDGISIVAHCDSTLNTWEKNKSSLNCEGKKKQTPHDVPILCAIKWTHFREYIVFIVIRQRFADICLRFSSSMWRRFCEMKKMAKPWLLTQINIGIKNICQIFFIDSKIVSLTSSSRFICFFSFWL